MQHLVHAGPGSTASSLQWRWQSSAQTAVHTRALRLASYSASKRLPGSARAHCNLFRVSDGRKDQLLAGFMVHGLLAMQAAFTAQCLAPRLITGRHSFSCQCEEHLMFAGVHHRGGRSAVLTHCDVATAQPIAELSFEQLDRQAEQISSQTKHFIAASASAASLTTAAWRCSQLRPRCSSRTQCSSCAWLYA